MATLQEQAEIIMSRGEKLKLRDLHLIALTVRKGKPTAIFFRYSKPVARFYDLTPSSLSRINYLATEWAGKQLVFSQTVWSNGDLATLLNPDPPTVPA